MVVGLLRPSGVAGTGRLVTAAGAFHWPVPRIAVWGAGDESACKYPVVSTTGLAIAVRRAVDNSLPKCSVVSTTGAAIAVRRPGNRSPSGRSALPAVRESPIGHCGAVRIVV